MSKAKNLGAGSSFAQARPISARRAAIGAATVAPTDGVPEPTELSIKLISQNPDNPRESLRGLDGLAESIREIGLVNAITVATVDAYLSERPHRAEDLDEDARYVVVDGHRRLAASQLAGKETIRVSFNDALVSTDESLLEAAFVANFHRDDMNPLEQAHALQKLVEFYGSQNKASKRLGIGQSTISSKLSILDLDPVLQADLLEGRRTVEDVRNLSKLSPEEQRQRADARAESRRQKAAALSRRDNPTEEQPVAPAPVAVSALATPPPAPPVAPARDADLSLRDNPAGGRTPTVKDSHASSPAPSAASAPAAPVAPAATASEEAVRRAPVPDPRPGRAEPPLPHGDGAAFMDYARSQLDPAQRSAMLQRYFQVASCVEEVAEDLRRDLAPKDRQDLAVIIRRIADLLGEA
ncbi:ParB family chromosome partitioning protein [Streptomyces sp. CZ24]|uniref:ParB/RepB/Spo0J family partition protein n=1 Tax=Streptomyces albidoflavus TaxID=1886 RepID=UPI0024771D9D|nr:ParB/RepB/Spo0J family partition protein [Streptomyces sp. CZ24]MDH6193274.1 ParB family chromosome partitioning protein [Streptomyces sp. CZ24]